MRSFLNKYFCNSEPELMDFYTTYFYLSLGVMSYSVFTSAFYRLKAMSRERNQPPTVETKETDVLDLDDSDDE